MAHVCNTPGTVCIPAATLGDSYHAFRVAQQVEAARQYLGLRQHYAIRFHTDQCWEEVQHYDWDFICRCGQNMLTPFFAHGGECCCGACRVRRGPVRRHRG
jgi:hypothetical protein